jgi:hypothetical protein
MKKILFIISLVLLLGNQSVAQPSEKDFVIVGYGTGDGNLQQVQKRYQKKSNAYLIKEAMANPLEQISKAIEGRSIRDLHIYSWEATGALKLNSITLTSENVNDFSQTLMKWKSSISGKVFIHSKTAFTTPEGVELKQKMEQISGLEFIMVN